MIEGHPRPITALKDKGAEICLIREDIISDWETSPTPVGSVKIRGIFGEPVDAELVSLRVKPHPGDEYENIAPSVNVIFAVCALATEVEVILCGTAVQELEVLSIYNVPKPSGTPVITVETVETTFKPDTSISDQVTELSTMNSGSSQQLELRGTVQSDEIEVKVTALNVTTDVSAFDAVLSPNTDNGGDDSSHSSRFLASRSHTKNDNPTEIAIAEKFKAEQTADVSLERAWAQAKASKGHFFVKSRLLYHSDQVLGQRVEQMCLPQKHVAEICRLAHDVYHQGIKRTNERIRSNLHWDGMSKTIKNCVNQCHECQMKARALVKDRVPI